MSARPQIGALGLLGHIDAIESGRIYGWAWNPEQPDDRVRVAIYHGDVLIDTVTADRFRQDLADQNMHDGRHAFVCDLPASLRDAGPEGLAAYFAGSEVPLSRHGALPVPAGQETAEGLAHRLARVEAGLQQLHRTLGAVLRDRDGQHTTERLRSMDRELLSQRRDLQAMAAQLAGCEKALADAEGFLLRFDKALTECPDRAEMAALKRQLARKPGWPALIAATLVVVLVEVALRQL